MSKARAKKMIAKKGYEDDCTPNYTSELVSLMLDYSAPYKEALKLITKHFPTHVLQSQMGEYFEKFNKCINN